MGSVTDDKHSLEAPTIAVLTLRFRSPNLAAEEKVGLLGSTAVQILAGQ